MFKSLNKGISTPVGILIIILILVVLGGGILAWQRGWLLKSPTGTPGVTATPTETPQAGPIDCKTNLDCLIEASRSCTPAKVIVTATVDIFGVKETATSFEEIKGVESGKCIFYIKLKKVDLIFPPEVPQEIVTQQKELYKKMEGKEGICKFATNDLTAVLTKWKNGDFDSGKVSCELVPGGKCTTTGGDFGVAECSGTYFEQPSLEDIQGKRISANISHSIEECPNQAESLPVQEDGTACFENQKDLGSIKGITVNGKPVQCCVPK